MSTTRAVLELLAPHRISMLKMERMGPEADGGYVVPSKLMHEATLLVTGGVADNLHFEEDIARSVLNIRIALFDHTIDVLPAHTPIQAVWHKLGLAAHDSENFLSLESACAKAGLAENDKLIVKLDIEGDEWNVLDNISGALMNRISVLIVEYHHLAKRQDWVKYRRVLEKIHKSFTLVHVHGNNHSTMVSVNRYGVQIPDVLEVTYIKRGMGDGIVWADAAPTVLDRANFTGVEDYSFNYWSDLSGKYRTRLWNRVLRLIKGRQR